MKISLPFFDSFHVYAPGSENGRQARLLQGQLATALDHVPAEVRTTAAPRQHRTLAGFTYGPGRRELATQVQALALNESARLSTLEERAHQQKQEEMRNKQRIRQETAETARNAFKTDDERWHALQKKPYWDDPAKLAEDIAAYVGPKLEAIRDQGEFPVMLIGEEHIQITSMLVEITAMKEMRRVFGPGATAMIEAPPDVLESILKPIQREYMDDLTSDIDGTARRTLEQKMLTRATTGDRNERRIDLMAQKCLAAELLGFKLAAFDTVHDLQNPGSPQREAAMVTTITEAHAQGPTIVFTGHTHIPALHGELAGPLVTVSSASVADMLFPDKLESMNYTLAHPEILCHQFEGDILDSPPSMLAFMESIGIELPKPSATN